MMNQFLQDLVIFAPEAVLLFGALTALMLGTFGSAKDGLRLANLAVAVTLAVAVFCLLQTPAAGEFSYGLHFAQTEATRLAKIIALLGGAGAFALSHHALVRVGAQKFEYGVLMLLALLGICLMISARDFMALYVGVELQSLSLYILAAFVRRDDRAAEAGIKYFILGALSSCLLLYGMSLLYGAAGTIQFTTLQQFMAAGQGSMAVTLALVFVVAALCFKISAAPFHMWTPDVYQGAATPVTAFFMTAPKVAGAMVMAQLLHGALAGQAAAWGQILAAASVLSLLVGGFAALWQTNIKRLLAYSTINHVGFLLLAILAGGEAGFAALLVYLAVYVILSLGNFAVILHLQQQGEVAEDIKDLTGIARRHPQSAMALAILMFTAAGVPPTAGFIGKLYVFIAAVQAGYFWLAALGVLTSVVATFYYLRIIKVMYFDEPTAPVILGKVAPSRRLVAVMVTALILSLGLMILPGLVVEPAAKAAKTMVMPVGS